MNILKNKINNYLSKYSIFIFAIITLLIMVHRNVFWDETHAFNISQLKLSEIFYLTRIEGHTFIWYLILKVFCPLNFYPYGMLIINWLFCILAIFILYKNAPFTPIQKTLITFSTPFVYYFAPVARCYAIGILLLFLICTLYKKRFKRPLLFSTLIALCANTSIMAAIGSFYIGLIYLFDIFLKLKHKTFSKKNTIGVLAIFSFCAIILILQFIEVRNPDIEEKTMVWNSFSRFVIYPQGTTIFPFILHFISTISFYYYTFLIFKNTKRGFFFISSTYITLTLLFLHIYHGSHWNHYFYFIYFIILFWIFGKKILVNKFSKFLFIAILFLFLFPKAVIETGKMDLIYASKAKEAAKEIAKIPDAQNAKIYSFEWWGDIAPGALGYLKQKNINIYDFHDRNRISFESQRDIFKMRRETIDAFELFNKNQDKKIYLATMSSIYMRKFSDMYIYSKDGKNFLLVRGNEKYFLKLINYNEKDMTLGIFEVIKL